MKNITLFFDHEEKNLLQATERLHKVLLHLRYEGKPTRGRNVREAKATAAHLVRTLKAHRRLQEDVIFPYLEVHVPKHEPAIRFLRGDHREIQKTKEGILRLLREAARGAANNEKDAGIHEAGAYFVCLVRQHVELEKKSIHKAFDHVLKADEKKEIAEKMARWLAAQKKAEKGG